MTEPCVLTEPQTSGQSSAAAVWIWPEEMQSMWEQRRSRPSPTSLAVLHL